MSSIDITKDNFNKEVLENDIPVIVDFWAPWCGPCQIMGPVFEKLSGEFAGKLKFVKVNTGEEESLASNFNIRSIPSLVLFNKGKEVDRILGAFDKEELKIELESKIKKI